MTGTITISLAELQADHDASEAETSILEEQTRISRERTERLAGMIRDLAAWTEEREKRGTVSKAQAELRPAPIATSSIVHRDPTAGEFAVRVLETAGKPLTTRELSEGMAALGYKTTSTKTLWEAVYGTLTGSLRVKGSRLVKFGANWGLREWKNLDAALG